jgi:radical SAM protein with 4Fe4S-binding SPASM domain
MGEAVESEDQGGVEAGILRVRRGRSPNCSAVGSVVGLALVSAVVGAAIVNAFADRLARWGQGSGGPAGGAGSGGEGGAGGGPDAAGGVGSGGGPDDGAGAASGPGTGAPGSGDAPRMRREAFGAVVAWNDPPALLHVDSPTADALESRTRAWGAGDDVAGALRAPTEVHVSVTDRCPVSCTGCYLGATPEPRNEPPLEVLVRQLDEAAAAGVFEVALGGGEASLRADLLELARHARARGLVPNLTTSGFGVTEANAAELAALFGQINVSIDGLGDTYTAVRGWDGAGRGLTALRRLRAAGAAVGVNTVITRRNADHLPELGARLAAEGVSEWQWLRFKPSGRGVEHYEAFKLTRAQAHALWPTALALEAELGLLVRFDCAMVPFVAEHVDDPSLARTLDVSGCVAGERLLTRSADGRWKPCSFAAEDAGDAPLAEAWRTDGTLQAWRSFAEALPDPCSTCAWADVCRGGCRVVSRHVAGESLVPDPECIKVAAR